MKIRIPRKIVTLFVGIFIFFILTYLFFDLLFGFSSIVDRYITNNLSASFITAVVIMLLLIADMVIPVPSSIVMMMSGMLFGPLVGGMIVLVGSLSGAIVNFQISRVIGREKVKKWLGNKEYANVATIIERYGAVIVILSRMLPLLMESVSALAGLSQMTLKKFVVVNVIGFVPTVFFYSYTGYFYQNEPENIFLILCIGFVVPLMIWFFLARISPFFQRIGN